MTSSGNHLVQSLPRKDRALFLSECQSISLQFAQVLSEAGEPARHVYFPIDCSISLIASNEGRASLEVGMVGREGMLGEQLFLGESAAPAHALVQRPGMAWQMTKSRFLQHLKDSEALRRIMQRYLYVRVLQSGTQAVCTHFHQVSPRLARWLLMSQDRAHTDSFRITQEFLAHLLGVRRVAITKAAGGLQHEGLIKYHHGFLTVLDRSGLEAVACTCYANDADAYDRLLA